VRVISPSEPIPRGWARYHLRPAEYSRTDKSRIDYGGSKTEFTCADRDYRFAVSEHISDGTESELSSVFAGGAPQRRGPLEPNTETPVGLVQFR
jgi:hypothetical protein